MEMICIDVKEKDNVMLIVNNNNNRNNNRLDKSF